MNVHVRNVGGAVLGWVVMALCVFVLMAVLWTALGVDGSFRPGSWEVTTAWSLGSVVIGLLAAVVGGIVCRKVAGDGRGVLMLIALVVVLGVANALFQPPATGAVRAEDVAMLEAAGSAEQPGWLAWLNPLLGLVGILLGARLARRE